MAKRSHSIAEYRTFHWISLLGALAGIAGLIAVWHTSYALWVAAGVSALLLAAIAFESVTHRAGGFFSSGLRRFIAEFTGERNAGVFEEIERSYAYLGVSFSTVVSDFSSWYENSRRGSTKIRLLIADPSDAEVFRFRAAYEMNQADQNLSAAERQARVTSGAAAFSEAVRFTLTTLARLPGAAESIQVRLHREKLHEWMHLVDGELLYLGLLRKGESGRKCPVAVYERRKKVSLFDHYSDWFELLWDESKDRQVRLAAFVPGGGTGGAA